MNVVRTLELCAGVGMLSEGIHAGLRHLGLTPRAVGYVERDAYAASVLLARMESQALEPAPVWAGNLEDVRWGRWHGAVDCIASGFPCQPHSMAGSRKGTGDARWIWPAIADCIRVVRPWLIVLENVSGLRSSGGMAPVLADLAALGYVTEWDSIRASDVGASHQRERIFIMAYCPEYRWEQGRPESARIWRGLDAAERGGGVGEPERPRWPPPWCGYSQHSRHESKQGCEGGKLRSARNPDGGRTEAYGPATELRSLFAPGPSDPRWPGIIRQWPEFAPATAQSEFRGVADGLAAVLDGSRQDRLRCVGNGVVALQAGLAVIHLGRRIGIS